MRLSEISPKRLSEAFDKELSELVPWVLEKMTAHAESGCAYDDCQDYDNDNVILDFDKSLKDDDLDIDINFEVRVTTTEDAPKVHAWAGDPYCGHQDCPAHILDKYAGEIRQVSDRVKELFKEQRIMAEAWNQE